MRLQMEPSTRLVTVVRTRSCTFRVILEKPSQWYEQTMEDSLLPSVTNMDTQIGVSTACHQEPPEYYKPSKSHFYHPERPGPTGHFQSLWTHFGQDRSLLFDVTAWYFKGLKLPFNFFFLGKTTLGQNSFLAVILVHASLFRVFGPRVWKES